MPPAAKKAPYDYLFALAVSVFVIATSFAVKPNTTKYVVLVTGVIMFLAVAAAAGKPEKSTGASNSDRTVPPHH